MLLFKDFHIPLILNGTKTATRRNWKKPRVRIGSIQQCKTKLFTSDYFAKVRILNVYPQRLQDMTDEDYQKEGGYTKETFIRAWTEINGGYDPNMVVFVVEFERAD